MKFCPTCKSKFPTDINYCPNDATKLVIDPEVGPSHSLIGMILDNRYRIISKLGEGGMGSVYAAEHILLKKNVAIKVLRYDLARKDDVVRRFQNEAIAASRIGHENIIEVTDFGKTPDGSVYFVMEHLNGSALADIIQKSGSIPQRRAIPILLQITKALSVAHSQGIIHRDLKPENIVLIEKPDRKDFVKILDFGISKMLDTSDRAEKLTAMGMIVGTPEYMSPEQAAGMSVDKRTDIYSLGVIMYEMLTGRLPFLADNAIRILMMHQTEKPIKPRDINPEIHTSFEYIILKCMEKKPEDRFQDMSEITQALIQIFSATGRVPEPKKTIAFTPQTILNAPEALVQPQIVQQGQSVTNPAKATIQYKSDEMPAIGSTAIPVKEVPPTKKTISGINNMANTAPVPVAQTPDIENTGTPISENLVNNQTSNTIEQASLQNTEVTPAATTSSPDRINLESYHLSMDKTKTAATAYEEESPTEQQPKKKSKGILIAVIFIVVVAIIGATIFMLMGKKETPQKTALQTNTNIPEQPVVKTEQKQEISETTKKEENTEVAKKEDEEEKKPEKEEKTTKVAKNIEAVILDISSVPENVEIYKGGSLLGVTPHQLKGRMNSSAEYIFKKPGYEPMKKKLTFDSSKKIQINLKKIEEAKKVTPQKEKDPFEKIDDLKDLKF